MVTTEIDRGFAVAALRYKRREVMNLWFARWIDFDRMMHLTRAIDLALLRQGVLR